MAKRQVILSTCDSCHKEEMSPLDKKSRRDELDLPKGWLHVEGSTATSTVFEMDLCADCKKSVLEAAGVATLRLVN